MNEFETFEKIENKSSYVFEKEELKFLQQMVKEAKFSGNIIIVPEDEKELLAENHGGVYDKTQNKIVLRMQRENEEKINYGSLEEISPFDKIACTLAHELGHSMDRNSYKTREAQLHTIQYLFENNAITYSDDRMGKEYKEAILDTEIAAWENGRTLIKDKKLLKVFDEMNKSSFDLYANKETQRENGRFVKGAAIMRALEATDLFRDHISNIKRIGKEAGVDFEKDEEYKKISLYKTIEAQVKMEKENDEIKPILKDKRFPVFFEVDVKDQSTVAYLKTVINEKIAAVYHPYDRLPEYMKVQQREIAREKGLQVLLPKEDDNKILYNLKNMKEKVKKKTVVVTEKLSNNFTEKIKDTGVKVVESLEKLPKFINSLAEKFVSKNLQKAVETQDVGETKEYLQMGVVPDKETKLAIVSSKNLKNELLSFLKPEKKEKSKEADREL